MAKSLNIHNYSRSTTAIKSIKPNVVAGPRFSGGGFNMSVPIVPANENANAVHSLIPKDQESAQENSVIVKVSAELPVLPLEKQTALQ